MKLGADRGKRVGVCESIEWTKRDVWYAATESGVIFDAVEYDPPMMRKREQRTILCGKITKHTYTYMFVLPPIK